MPADDDSPEPSWGSGGERTALCHWRLRRSAKAEHCGGLQPGDGFLVQSGKYEQQAKVFAARSVGKGTFGARGEEKNEVVGRLEVLGGGGRQTRISRVGKQRKEKGGVEQYGSRWDLLGHIWGRQVMLSLGTACW